MAQAGNEGDGFPFSLRNMTDQPLAARAAATDTDHIRGDRRLGDKHQPRRIKEPLLPNPAPARSPYVSSTSLSCTEAFFIGEVMTLEKSPERDAPCLAAQVSALVLSEFHAY